MVLSNEIITLEVNEHGAEPVSLVKDGREYMWTAEAAFWNRHAPILFPAVGKPFDNTVHIGSKAYTIKQHGFARDCQFVEAGPGLLKLAEPTDPEVYPYRFGLEARYSLEGSGVKIEWAIENQGDEDMYAQIGAHPGFLMPGYDPADEVHGYVRYFDKNGNPVNPVMVSGLDGGNRVQLPEPVRIPAEMPIDNDTFAHDAARSQRQSSATRTACPCCVSSAPRPRPAASGRRTSPAAPSSAWSTGAAYATARATPAMSRAATASTASRPAGLTASRM